MTQATTQHTPGPWQIDDCPDAQGFCTIRHADGTPHGGTELAPIATVYGDRDASLIAAAPELLAALYSIANETSAWGECVGIAMDALQGIAAIDQAKGL